MAHVKMIANVKIISITSVDNVAPNSSPLSTPTFAKVS